MQPITAQLNNLRQSPRKVRIVANLVRGKKVADAVLTLQFADKKASLPLRKLIDSALANAKAQSVETDNLIVSRIEVNAGKTLMRRRPAPHGSPHPIHKRTSHVFVALATKTVIGPESLVDSGEKTKTEIKPKTKKPASKLKTNN